MIGCHKVSSLGAAKKRQGGGGSRWATLVGGSYDGISSNFSAQIVTIAGIAFSDDGTKLYVGELGGDDDYHYYTLSGAYDIVNKTFVAQYSLGSEPASFVFRNGGLREYHIESGTSSRIISFPMSTAFDITTRGAVTQFSISLQVLSARGLYVSQDETYAIVMGHDGVLHKYNFGIAGDVASLSYDTAVTTLDSGGNTAIDMHVSPDASELYVLINTGTASGEVRQYSLSTPGDFSTASYDGIAFDVSPQLTTNVGALTFSTDGSKMYVGSTSDENIYQYSTG